MIGKTGGLQRRIAIAAGRPASSAAQLAEPNPIGVRLSWLGQAGFAIGSPAGLVLLDPYLSDSLAVKYAGQHFPHTRLYPSPVDPADLTTVTLVCCSHRHTDHMDRDTILALAAASNCQFLVPRAWTERMAGFGIDPRRVIGIDAGETAEFGHDLSVCAVLAAHESIEYDAAGHSLFLGYVIRVGGISVYHSGDCVPYDGQAERLRKIGVDVALLPINGRDADRLAHGVPGNFHPREAIALAEAIEAEVLIGHHWGLFEFNTVNEDDLTDAIADLAGRVAFVRPEVGRTYEIVTVS